MSKPLIVDLGTIADISVGGTTAPMKLDEQYGWSLAPVVVGTPSTAKYTVEVSQDNVTYHEYSIASTDVPIESPLKDDGFNWNWIRITVTSGGISSGTAQFGFL